MRINTFDDFQKMALDRSIYPEDAQIYYPSMGLTGEVGEVCEKVAELTTLRMASHAGQAANQAKKILRDDDGELTEARKAAIGKEIGGVLWYCAALATDLGLNLGDIARENAAILADREERGTLRGDGDNR